MMRFVQSYAHAHAYPHTPKRICMRTHTCSSSKQTEHSRGGCPCRLCPMRNVWRYAPFLNALCTHYISRSGPRPPTRNQRIFTSLAVVSVVAGPVSHAHPVASKRPPDPTPHTHIVFYFNHEANRGSLPALALRELIYMLHVNELATPLQPALPPPGPPSQFRTVGKKFAPNCPTPQTSALFSGPHRLSGSLGSS